MLSQSTFRRIEYRLFCSIILLNVILLFTTKFYPTMDGPSHLYNVEVIKQLIAGNETIAEFFDINPIAIPNWTGHFLLLLFRFFAPSWLAEKFLISLYIIMLPVSFRMLVRKLSGQKCSEGQLKEGMQRHATCINSGYARRSGNGHFFQAVFADIFKKSSFTSTRFTSQEKVSACLVYKSQGLFKSHIAIITLHREK